MSLSVTLRVLQIYKDRIGRGCCESITECNGVDIPNGYFSAVFNKVVALCAWVSEYSTVPNVRTCDEVAEFT